MKVEQGKNKKTAGLFSFGGSLEKGLGQGARLPLSSAMDREPKVKIKRAAN
ncbi:MAG: hypothetical protein JSS01_04925 [Proteobacteria bacterium]|nr:hypothetical protein [Pseudomonadota bacterium]